MKTSLVFIAFGIGLLLWVWAAMSTHALFWDNDKSVIQASLLVALTFIAVGVIAYLI